MNGVKGWLLLLALWFAGGAAAGQLAIIELKHRLPEQVLPTLRPLLAPGGSLTGAQNQLFVRTTPDNLAELKAVLATLDQPQRRLLISVGQGNSTQRSGSAAGLNGASVSIGEQSQMRVSGGLAASRGSSSHNVRQQVQTLEGSPARIHIGESFPLPMRQWVIGPDGAVITDSIQYVDVGSGFYASARVVGEQVTLTISPQQQQLRGDASIDSAGLETTVSGRLGEWIDLGGSTLSRSDQQQGLLGGGERQQQGQQQVQLKVELLP